MNHIWNILRKQRRSSDEIRRLEQRDDDNNIERGKRSEIGNIFLLIHDCHVKNHDRSPYDPI